MQPSIRSSALWLLRYLDSLQVSLIRGVLEQPNFRKQLRWGVLCIFLLYAAVSLKASADTSLLQLDSIDAKFRGFQNSWYSVVKGFAQGLFWKLVLIDFGWTAVIYVLEKNDFAEVLSSLVRKIFTVGFFFALLKMSDSWIPAIIQSFITIGKAAAGVGDLTPDGIVNKGLDLAMGAFQTLKGLGVTEKIVVVFPVTFMALLIFLAFLWVAAQLLVTLVESYIAIGLGVILLGFGGSRWTTDFATKYLQFAVGTGIKLMLLYAIVGGGQTLFSGQLIDPNELIKSCMVILGVSFVYTYLAINIPQLSAAMMSGSPNLTAGGLAGAAATVAGAAVGAGAAAAATGAAAAGGVGQGAAGASGLHQALNAGLASAGDHGKSGIGALGHAIGEVASHGAGLAGGAASGTAQSARSAFADKVGQSAGGKIASSIEASRGGSVAGVPAPAPASPAAGATAGAQTAPAGDTSSATSDVGSTPAASEGSSGASSDGGVAAAGTSNSEAVSASAGGAATPVAAGSTPSSPSATSAGVGTTGTPQAASAAPAAAPVASAPSTPTAAQAPTAPQPKAPQPQSAAASPSPAVAGSSIDGAGALDAGANSATGDASTASLSGDRQLPTASSGQGKGEKPSSLAERVRGLEGYIPQDGAANAAINIDISHTRD